MMNSPMRYERSKPSCAARGTTGLILSLQVAWLLTAGLWAIPGALSAAGATDFPGTVLTVDAAAGKFAVKKEGGGTRFTFTANEKTVFEGGPKTVGDLKKDDHVIVTYLVQGSLYVALKVSLKK